MKIINKIITIFLINIIFITNIYALDINSRNVILYNLNDDTLIYEKDSTNKVSIASLTKIMTCLVAIENIDDFDEKVVITYDMLAGLIEANAAVVGFYEGQELTLNDLLYATFLASGADAARGLALSISSSEAEYVNLMNEKAKELEVDLHFANVVGLDDELNYGNVKDVAKLLKEALKNDTFNKLFHTKEYTVSDNSVTVKSTTFQTASYYEIDIPYIEGAKTGYTDDAGKCLASVAYDEVNDIRYMLVTTGADTTSSTAYHILDAKNIYDYYFENYKYYDVVNIGDLLTTIKVKYSNELINIISDDYINLYYDKTFNKDNIKIIYDGIDEVSPFIKEDIKLGNIKIYYEDTLLKDIELTSNMLDSNILKKVKKHIGYICLGIIVFLMILLYSIHLLLKKKKKA